MLSLSICNQEYCHLSKLTVPSHRVLHYVQKAQVHCAMVQMAEILCYAETLCSKIWTLCSKCRNACIIICSKAEVFIHVPEMFVHAAGQNFAWLSYTELKITATGLNVQQLLIFFSSRKQHQRTIHTSNLSGQVSFFVLRP